MNKLKHKSDPVHSDHTFSYEGMTVTAHYTYQDGRYQINSVLHAGEDITAFFERMHLIDSLVDVLVASMEGWV